MPNNLPELRDIHLPETVSVFPLAYGWWVVLLCAVAVVLSYFTIRNLLAKSKKRHALRLLNLINFSDIIPAAASMSEILRRICVYKYPEAAAMTPDNWVIFLNSHTRRKLSNKTAKLLAVAPYLPPQNKQYTKEDVKDLQTFCQRWIGENL